MLVKAERTARNEFTAWTEYGGKGLQIITKNAFTFEAMRDQILKFWTNSPDDRLEVIYNDYTDEEGNIKLPKEF